MAFFIGGSTYVVPISHQDHHSKLNPSYNEILKLNTMLDNAKIPHIMRRLDDGWQVIYTPYHPDSWVADAIETYYSYGAEDDLLELAGRLLTGEELKRYSVVGGLTANDVFQRISKHWEEREKHIEETYAIIKEKDVNWIV